MLGARATDLENRLAVQGKMLAERGMENHQLDQQLEALQTSEQSLRQQAATSVPANSPAFEKLRAEKALLEEQLTAAREERAGMQRELNAIKSQAELSWATERMENAVLRERINDIAAEVAKLAITLEGPDSPIEAILAVEARTPDQSYAQGMAAQRRRAERRKRQQACRDPSRCRASRQPRPRARWPTASAPCRARPRARNRRVDAACRAILFLTPRPRAS